MPDHSVIKVVEKEQALVMSNNYYEFLFKVPYFHHLSKGEKAEVKRIFEQVLMNGISHLAHYHYDNVRVRENGVSYVVDNLRHILALPGVDEAAYTVKFLLIASLGKMKFLSKRNIDLIFVERETMMSGLLLKNGTRKRVYLKSVLILFDRISVSSDALLYSENSEVVYYLGMTFVRWARLGGMSLREVITHQEVFGIEIPPMGDASLSISMNMFISSFLEPFSLPYNSSLDPVKVLCNKKKYDGLIDATVEDVEDYLSFFRWESGLVENGKRSVCSFSDFKEGFHLEKEKFSDLYAGVYADFPLWLRDDEGNPNLLSLQKKCFFLFCLLKGDEEKFSDLFNAIMENAGMFRTMTSEQTYDFLNMVREYGECDYLIPVSLLSGLHGLDEVFVD